MITFKQLLEKKMKGEDPCWDDYEMVGMKEKNGKKVPNCVPKQEGYVSDAQRKAVWAARNEKGVKEEVELDEGQVTSKELDSGAHDVFYNGKHIGTVHSKKVQWFGGRTTNKISAKYHTGEKVDVNPDNKGRTTLDSAKASLVYHHLRNSMKEEVEINEAKIPVEHAVKAVTRVLGSQSAARFATHLKPGTEKHTSWDKVNDALKKQGVKPKHIADIAVHVRPAQYEEVDLDEAVSVEHDRYMRSHGKKASGTGTWMFTHKRAGDVDYKNDKEVHQARGSFSDAAKSAKAWAKSHGHSTVYVMEEVESVAEGSEEQDDDYSTASFEKWKKQKEYEREYDKKKPAKPTVPDNKNKKKGVAEEVELDESGFADDFLKMVQKRHPQAKLTTGAEKKKEAEDLMKKRVASGAKPAYPHPGPDKYPLGGYDPVSKRSYSEEVKIDEAKGALTYKPEHAKWGVVPKSSKEFVKFFPKDKEADAKAHAEKTGGTLKKIDQAGRAMKEEVEQVDEISTELKQKYLGAATKKHLQQFLGRAPVRGKQELDKRRAAIQKTSKELTGKTHYREEVDQKMLSFGEFITK